MLLASIGLVPRVLLVLLARHLLLVAQQVLHAHPARWVHTQLEVQCVLIVQLVHHLLLEVSQVVPALCALRVCTPVEVHHASHVLVARIKRPRVNHPVLLVLQESMVLIQDRQAKVQLVQVLVLQASRLLQEAMT